MTTMENLPEVVPLEEWPAARMELLVKEKELTREFFVEVADEVGPRTVGLDEVLTFDGVRDTVEAIATQLAGGLGEGCAE